jgi:hypothetical protein
MQVDIQNKKLKVINILWKFQFEQLIKIDITNAANLNE